jgi:Holliday junction resolvase RusA-like endonuclease
MYNLTLIMPGLPKTYNSLRYRHYAYAQERSIWSRRITEQILKHNILRPITPLGLCKITYTLASSKERDHDNLVGGYKIVQDLLIDFGFIKDDNVTVIGHPDYIQIRAKPCEGFIKIEITEIMEAS